jgi:single-strand DNA-binding protein
VTSTNHVLLTGKIAKSPRRSFRPDGSWVVQFPLELDDSGDPENPKTRSLIEVVAFGKLAEAGSTHLLTGQHLQVEGRLRQRQWRTPEGRQRMRTEVIATDLQSLDRRNSGERGKET